MKKGRDICTETQKRRGRPRRNILENTVEQISVKLKLEDARNINKIKNMTGIKSKTEIVKNALKMYAESLNDDNLW